MFSKLRRSKSEAAAHEPPERLMLSGMPALKYLRKSKKKSIPEKSLNTSYGGLSENARLGFPAEESEMRYIGPKSHLEDRQIPSLMSNNGNLNSRPNNAPTNLDNLRERHKVVVSKVGDINHIDRLKAMSFEQKESLMYYDEIVSKTPVVEEKPKFKAEKKPRMKKNDANRGHGLYSIKKKRRESREDYVHRNLQALTPKERESILYLDDILQKEEDSFQELVDYRENDPEEDNLSMKSLSSFGSVIDMVGNLESLTPSPNAQPKRTKNVEPPSEEYVLSEEKKITVLEDMKVETTNENKEITDIYAEVKKPKKHKSKHRDKDHQNKSRDRHRRREKRNSKSEKEHSENISTNSSNSLSSLPKPKEDQTDEPMPDLLQSAPEGWDEPTAKSSRQFWNHLSKQNDVNSNPAITKADIVQASTELNRINISDHSKHTRQVAPKKDTPKTSNTTELPKTKTQRNHENGERRRKERKKGLQQKPSSTTNEKHTNKTNRHSYKAPISLDDNGNLKQNGGLTTQCINPGQRKVQKLEDKSKLKYNNLNSENHNKKSNTKILST